MKFLPVLIALLALTCVAPAFADEDRACAPIAQALDPTEATATNDYLNLTDGTFGTTHAVEDEWIAPVDMKFWGLYVKSLAAAGAGDTWTITVIDDNASTLLSCSISGASATTCTNVDATVSIKKASTVTVLVSSAAGASAPDTNGEMLISFCSQPSKTRVK